MGTVYNARVLEWFDCGRTELLRAADVPYAQMERRGVGLPVIEAHVTYRGRASYDDLLAVRTTCEMAGNARLRFDVTVTRAADGACVAEGYTVHAVTDARGRPVRPPPWLLAALGSAGRGEYSGGRPSRPLGRVRPTSG
jgi:acyl-CoA thioester hydrolase